MAANFPCPLQSCTVGFSLFFFKILFAKLAIKSPYLTDSERSAAELYLLIFYCVLPENLCFCVLCIIMIRLSYNKLFWKLRLKSYPLRTFVFFVCMLGSSLAGSAPSQEKGLTPPDYNVVGLEGFPPALNF